MAIAMPTTDIGAPGNSTTMPRMLNQAAAPAGAMAATCAVNVSDIPDRDESDVSAVTAGFPESSRFAGHPLP